MNDTDRNANFSTSTHNLEIEKRCMLCRAFCTKRNIIRLFCLGVFILSTVLLAYFYQKDIFAALNYLGNMGFGGAAIFIVLETICITLCIPCTSFEIGAGLIYRERIWIAALVSSIGKLGGSCFSFILGRFVLSDEFLNKILGNSSSFLRRPVGWEKHKMLLLISFAYIPMFIKNYGISSMETVSAVEFVMYVVFTGLPYSFYWAWLGWQSADYFLDPSKKNDDSNRIVKYSVTAAGVVVLFVLLFVIGKMAKQELLKEKSKEGTISVTEAPISFHDSLCTNEKNSLIQQGEENI